MDTDLVYADRKIAEAEEALSNLMALEFSARTAGCDVDFGVAGSQQELRQWREFKALLLIRKGMLGRG